MSKFSVKKPLTVLVAVITVLVLGVVSYTRMTPDLLPNINLPYVIIATSYVGATPEKVEAEVTKPLEQRMATLDDIDTVTSTSSENYSMVILSFNESVNMDTITVDILQKIQQLQGGWDDMVGTPTILKLNPNMLPVMIAAVDMEGMDITELSQFMEDTVINKLEGITGVASVSASGILAQQIEIQLDADKIEAMNQLVRAAVLGEIDEKEADLRDTIAEMEDKLDDIEKGKDGIQEGKDALVDGIVSGASKTAEGQAQLSEGKRVLYSQKAEAEDGLATLDIFIEVLETVQATLDRLQGYVDEINGHIVSILEMSGEIVRISALEEAYDASVDLIENDPELSDEEKQQQLDALYAQYDAMDFFTDRAELDLQLAMMGVTRGPDFTVEVAIGELKVELGFIELEIAEAEEQLSLLGLSRATISDKLAELKSSRQQVIEGIAYLDMMIKAADEGEAFLVDSAGQLERGMIEGILGISELKTTMLVGEATLSQVLTQLESGLEQVEDGRKAAIKGADLNNIITMKMVSSIIGAQDFAMPAGYVTDGTLSVMVSVGDEITGIAELEDLILLDMGFDDLAPIRLSDVANIVVTDNSDEIYANINGNSGVLLTFNKQSNYSTAGVSDNILAAFESLEAEYEGLRFTSLMDQGDYIYLVVKSVIENLLWGAVLAVIILFIFLKDIRPTFITLCSIPVSVIFAFVLMYFAGITLNMLSLSGLAVAVGMLVDNSVVVIENIYRLRSKGYTAVQAAVSGAGQVGGAIASSTLTTVAIFIPIVFIEGLTRDLFTDFALTFAFALIASLIIALTVVPSMASRVLEKEYTPKKSPIMDGVKRVYAKMLGWVLDHKIIILAASLALLILSGIVELGRGFTFMPEMDMGQLTVSVEVPEDADFEDATRIADAVVESIGTVEGVETVGAMIGSSGLSLGALSGGGGGNDITMYVVLDESSKRSTEEIGNEILDKTAGLEGEVSVSSSSGMDISMLAGSGVSVVLYGEDLDLMRETARDLAVLLEGVEGVAEVDDGIGETSPALRVTVDKEKAMEHSLTVAQVYMEIAEQLTTTATVTSITTDGKSYDVVIDSSGQEERDVAFIRTFTFTVEDRDGEEIEVPLAEIATITDTETLNSISRDEGNRYLSMTAEIDGNYNVTNVSREIQSALDGYDLPGGVRLELSGESETIMEAVSELMLMLLLGIVLVYLIMVAQFQSLKSPFIVMFTIPLAFTGGLLALFLTGYEVSIIALIGFVMLVGLIVNNGIVLVDFINQLRMEGVPTREAIIEAGTTRMRPILMTTITTIFGLVTMALGLGSGGAMMQPLAIVCIGGLTYATVLTLFVVPALYQLLNRKEMRVIDEKELEIVDDHE